MVYSDALARIHAAGFAPESDAALDWLAGLAGDAPVFDVGCGDGRVLAGLAARGVAGSGIDISESFVTLAKAQGLSVTTGDAAEAVIPDGTGLILALGEVLSYARSDTPALAAFLPRLRDQPTETRLICDLISPDVPPGGGWLDGKGWLVTARTHRDGRRYVREIVSFVAESDRWIRTDETHLQIATTRHEVQAGFEAVGWQVRFMDGFGDMPLLPGRIGVMATRR